MSSTASGIPVVDFSSLSLNHEDEELDESGIKTIADKIINAYSTLGFVYLSNTHFPEQLLKKATVVSDQFFDLPLSSKQKYARDAKTSHGYVASGQEYVNPSRPGDLKEGFNGNLELLNNASVWPSNEVPGFRQTMNEFADRCCVLTRRVLLALAYGLELPDKKYFDKCHSHLGGPGNATVLRLLRYPPLSTAEEIKPRQMRLGEHSDYGTITLVFQLDSEGLQVRKTDGEWIDAVPIPNTVLVNIGDLLQRWTSDRLLSTGHRVMIPDEEVKRQAMRRSIVFFVEPDHDVTVSCLDGSDKYSPVKGSEYVQSKLKASYLY